MARRRSPKRQRGAVSRPAVEAPAGPKRVLHVGCGPPGPNQVPVRYRGDDWREVRYDIDPGVEPDIVGSIVDMSPVASGSVDAIWSSHNLEHVYAHEVPLVIGEFYRVLRPAGEALITLPDLQAIAEFIVQDKLEDTAYVSPAGPITPLDVVYGYGKAIKQGNEFMAHRTGFTAKTLGAKLRRAGFRDVTLERKDLALWALGRKKQRASGR